MCMRKLYFLFVAIIALSSCRKEATRWNSDWSAPILNDTLTLMNWVNDSTITVSPSGYYDVNLKRKLFRFDLNSIVGIPDTTLQNNYSLAAGISVPPGTSFVNQTQERDLNLDPIELTKIHLKEGEILILIKNPYPTKVICSLALPGVTKNGVEVSTTLEVAAGSLGNPTQGTKTINLAGAQMDLSGLSGGDNNKLQSKITVTTDPNGPSVVSTSSYVTQIFATIKNVKLEYAKGYFGQQSFSDTVETDVELLKKWIDGTIDLPNLSLNLKLSNGIKAMGKINLKELTTIKSNGTTTSLMASQINVPQNVNSASGSWSGLSPSITNYSFQSSNSNIQDFIENAGPKIKLIYDFTINPFGNISGSWNEIFPQSAVVLDLNLTMPLGLELDNFTITDTFKLDFTKYKKQLDQGRSADIIIDLQNSFPIQGGLMLKFVDENNQTIAALPEFKTIQSGLFGTALSSGAQVQGSNITWHLTEDDFKNLSSTSKIVVTAKFNTPDPATMSNSSVLLSEKCFLGCKLHMNLQYETKYE
jgi:hypothetical protein